MALSGTITGTYRGYTLSAAWKATQNAAGNYSDIVITHTLSMGSAYSLKIGGRSNSCTVDGGAQSYTSPAINQKGGSVTLGTTTHRVNHNADGSKTCTITDVFNISATLDGVQVSNITATGNITLDRIPRQASIQTAADFTDAGNPSLTYSNPGGFTADAYIEYGSGSTIMRAGAIKATSGTYTFSLSDAERAALRAACTGQTMPVTYVLRTTISGTAYYSRLARTMTIAGAAPILGAVSYADANTATTAVTGDASIIVQGQSDLRVTYSAATGQKGATIASYAATFAGVTKTAASAGTFDFGAVDVSTSQPLTFTVTDSRGLTSSATLTVKVEAWWQPTSTVQLGRVNNFEPETHITALAYYASIGGKNSVTVTARYRKAGSSDAWASATLTDGVQTTITCDRDYAYEFEVTTADKLGSGTQALTLGRGIPTFFLDTAKSSVGVNCFPASNGVLQLGENAFLTAQGAYPVGAVYISVTDTDPATLFGGTWQRIAQGRFLIGAGPNEANTTDYWGSYPAGSENFPAGEMGGETTHKLTVDEMPSHSHSLRFEWSNEKRWGIPQTGLDCNNGVDWGATTGSAGGDKAHNNMPPYLVCYMWRRVS